MSKAHRVIPLNAQQNASKKKTRTSKQVNFRAWEASVAYWKEAAETDGFKTIGSWLKWLANKRAGEVFADRDAPHR